MAVLDVAGEVKGGDTDVGAVETVGSLESGRLGVQQDHITGRSLFSACSRGLSRGVRTGEHRFPAGEQGQHTP